MNRNNTVRRRLPDTRISITHKFVVGGCKGYLNVGIYEDGSPGELFIKMDKSEFNGWTNTVGILVSLALQSGVDLEAIVNKLAHQRFEPSGPTKNPDIRIATSIVDYVARWLGYRFIPEYGKEKRSMEAKANYGSAKSA